MTETTWDYVVQDFSPLLTYFGAKGSGDHHGANLDSAWEQTCPIAPSAQLGSLTVCDLSSTHTTNVPGAGVSLAFYGQAIQLVGNVTGGMEYAVVLDGTISAGNPGVQSLASFQGLVPGYHNISIIASPPHPKSAATLLFESAVVTVGTGLTGANVTRTVIQDGDPSLSYTPSVWQTVWFEDWGLQHTPGNTTWHHILAGTSGNVSLNYNAADAIIAHGASWSFFPSTYRVIRDGETPKIFYGNSSLEDASPSYSFLDAVMAFEPNPSQALRKLTIDNANGEGHLGIDYFEVISVSGGTPINNTASVDPPSNPPSPPTAKPQAAASRTIPAAAIVAPIMGLFLLLVVLGILLYWRRRRRQGLQKVDFESVTEPWFFPDRMVQQNPDTRSDTL